MYSRLEDVAVTRANVPLASTFVRGRSPADEKLPVRQPPTWGRPGKARKCDCLGISRCV